MNNKDNVWKQESVVSSTRKVPAHKSAGKDRANTALSRAIKSSRRFVAVFLSLLLVFAALEALGVDTRFLGIDGMKTAKADTTSIVPWDGRTTTDFTSNGSGTEQNPYLISNGAELAFLAEMTNENGDIYNNKLKGKYFKLTKDIDLNDKQWTPIGWKDDLFFSGSFDGDGHVIYGLKIDASPYSGIATQFLYYGLFGSIINEHGDDCSLKNLTVLGNIEINANNSDSESWDINAAGLLGMAYEVEISNCVFNGTVTCSGDGADYHVGGITGYADNSTIFESCYSSGEILANTSSGLVNVGGISGYIGTRSSVSECYNLAGISYTGQCRNYASSGGIAGVTSASSDGVSDCFNMGDVTCTNFYSSRAYTGGIVGRNHKTVSYCYSTGKNNGADLLIVGVNEDGASVTNSFYLSDSEGESVGMGNPTDEGLMKSVTTYEGGEGDGWETRRWWKLSDSYYPLLRALPFPQKTERATFVATGPDSGTLNVEAEASYSLTYSGDSRLKYAGESGTIEISGVCEGLLSVSKAYNSPENKCDFGIPQYIFVNKASAPTGIAGANCTNAGNTDGKLTGVSASMEYKKSDAASWTPCTGTTVAGLVPGTYYVRTKASGATLASEYVSVTVGSSGSPDPVPPGPVPPAPVNPDVPYIPPFAPNEPEDPAQDPEQDPGQDPEADPGKDPEQDPEADPGKDPEQKPEQTGKKSATKPKASFKNGRINLGWREIADAEKYGIYQKISGKFKKLRETDNLKAGIKRAYAKIDGEQVKTEIIPGRKYTFAIRAFVNGKWTKITKKSTTTIKIDEP